MLLSVGSARTLGMPVPPLRVKQGALTFLYVALGCVGALELFQVILEQYAIARFWEPWVAKYPTTATYLPLCVIALASGTLVGGLIGVLAQTKALGIAGWAGLG